MNFKKTACIDAMYTEIPFLDRFKAAKNDGFDYIEFWGWTDKDIDAVKDMVQKTGICVSGFNGDAEYSLIDPAHKEKYFDFLRQSIKIAKDIGALSLTIHSNGLGDMGKVINHYEDVSDTIKLCSMYQGLLQCAELSEKNDIRLNLEPLNIVTDHVGNYLSSTKMAAELIELIGQPRLKVLYDVYHMQLNEGNLCNNLTKYINQIGHIHVADVPGRHEPGTGEINYHKIFSHLENIGYTGKIGFELFPANSTKMAVEAIMKY